MMMSYNGMSISDSSVPTPNSDLLLAAQLAVANPTRQNPKLIGQALSAAPPVLKLFWQKFVLALVEEGQQVMFEQGP